jgi:hypothetical protein
MHGLSTIKKLNEIAEAHANIPRDLAAAEERWSKESPLEEAYREHLDYKKDGK